MSMTERYNKSHLSFLVAGLVSLRAQAEDGFDLAAEGQPFVADEETGICGNVTQYISKAVLPDEIVSQPAGDGGSRECIEETFKRLTIELFVLWPHYSGNSYYPVPASPGQREEFEECWGGNCDSAEAAENAFEYSGLHWAGEYGDYRMDLLNHMIDRLTEALVVEEPVAVPETTGVTTYNTPAAAHKPSHGGYPG